MTIMKIRGYIIADHKYILYYNDNIDIKEFFEKYEDYIIEYSQDYDEISFQLSND